MIVVEGPDGAGKTTLVKKVCDLYGLEVGTRGTTNRDLLYTVTVHDTMRALGLAAEGKDAPRVWDRLYYSDFAYAPMMLREVAFNSSQQQHVQRVIGALHCPVIVCLPDFEVVRANAYKQHQMEGVNENLRRIYDTYYEMTFGDKARFPEHRVVYDYTDHTTLEHVLEEIEDYLEDRQERMPG